MEVILFLLLQSLTDMFLSEGSIIFLPYTLSAGSAFSNQLIQALATKITTVLSKVSKKNPTIRSSQA